MLLGSDRSESLRGTFGELQIASLCTREPTHKSCLWLSEYHPDWMPSPFLELETGSTLAHNILWGLPFKVFD